MSSGDIKVTILNITALSQVGSKKLSGGSFFVQASLNGGARGKTRQLSKPKDQDVITFKESFDFVDALKEGYFMRIEAFRSGMLSNTLYASSDIPVDQIILNKPASQKIATNLHEIEINLEIFAKLNDAPPDSTLKGIIERQRYSLAPAAATPAMPVLFPSQNVAPVVPMPVQNTGMIGYRVFRGKQIEDACYEAQKWMQTIQSLQVVSIHSHCNKDDSIELVVWYRA